MEPVSCWKPVLISIVEAYRAKVSSSLKTYVGDFGTKWLLNNQLRRSYRDTFYHNENEKGTASSEQSDGSEENIDK